MTKIIFFLYVCFSLLGNSTCVNAQNSSYVPLNMGSSFPNVIFTDLSSQKQYSILQERGKWIILDYWNVWCSSCISAMPHLNELQKKYSDRIKIFLITTDPQWKVDNQKKISKYLRDNQLPVISGDTIFSKLTPYGSVPTQALISPDGIYTNIIAASFLTEETLLKLLSQKSFKIPTKNNFVTYDADAPLISEGAGRNLVNLLEYSMFFKGIRIPKAGSYSEFDSISKEIKRLTLYNLPQSLLYLNAYSSGLWERHELGRLSRIYLEGIPDSIFSNPIVGDPILRKEWSERNTYSYEIKIAIPNTEKLYKKVIEDLDFYLGNRSTIEKRHVTCWVLKKIDKQVKTIQDIKSATNLSISISEDGKNLELISATSADLVNVLANINRKSNFPILDSSGLANDKLQKIRINGDLSDFTLINNSLNDIGLRFYLETCFIDMIVIRKN